jgi:hypothetical protein
VELPQFHCGNKSMPILFLIIFGIRYPMDTGLSRTTYRRKKTGPWAGFSAGAKQLSCLRPMPEQQPKQQQPSRRSQQP